MKRARHQHSTAVFVVLEHDGAICLLRRSGTGWMDGQFSLPAGALEAGETIRAAAIREVREEVGVEIEPGSLHHAHVLHSLTEGADWLGHFFVARRWTGEPRICEPAKHSEILWTVLARLPDDLIPYVRQALGAITRGEVYSEYGWPSES
jgi:8-oxo-dGTP pyrophosphatase MutT (NUDIX family)